MEFDLKYNICFCKAGDKILMLHRNRPPNKGRWNGVGGKIEPGEDLDAALRREVLEETGLDVNNASHIHYGGIVTWRGAHDPNNENKGMHAYVAEFSIEHMERSLQEVPEGMLAWKDISWVCDHANKEVVENIPYFLPRMLSLLDPVEYHCVYKNQLLRELTIRPRNETSLQQ